MNYNNNKCNNRGTCSECKSEAWLGELIQLENWKEKGLLCRDCLIKIKIPCCHCSKFFNKIENFSEWEKSNYEQHERIDRKKWKKEKPSEKCWPYIGCEYYIHGGQFCNKKECKGHCVPQHGHYCSKDGHDEQLGGANLEGSKYKEWKEYAEKLGWTPCQEKDLFRDWDNHPKLSTYKEKIRKKEGEQALACDKMAAPGEKYCFHCECERKGEKWGDNHRNNEKNWVKSYRDYWNLTNDKNDWPNNRENISESSTLVSSSNDNKIEKLEKELIEAKRQRKSIQEIERLQSELQKLSNNRQRKEEIKPAKNNNLLISGVIIFLVSTLILGVILVNKTAKKQKK